MNKAINKVFCIEYTEKDFNNNDIVKKQTFYGTYGIEKFVYWLLVNKDNIIDISIWDYLEDDEPL